MQSVHVLCFGFANVAEDSSILVAAPILKDFGEIAEGGDDHKSGDHVPLCGRILCSRGIRESMPHAEDFKTGPWRDRRALGGFNRSSGKRAGIGISPKKHPSRPPLRFRRLDREDRRGPRPRIYASPAGPTKQTRIQRISTPDSRPFFFFFSHQRDPAVYCKCRWLLVTQQTCLSRACPLRRARDPLPRVPLLRVFVPSCLT